MARLADPHRSGAVLLGVGSYDHLPGLPTVSNNLAALSRALTDHSRWGLPEPNCRIVTDPRSPLDVQSTVLDSAQEVDSEGLFLLYFAGHGIIDTRTGDLYLAVMGSRAQDAYATAVPYEWIRRIVHDSPASQRAVILDCCYAGRAIAGMGAESALADEVAIDRACVLVAASANRLALAPPDETYTAFTGVLVELLDRGVPGGPDPLDVGTCYEEITRVQRERGRPLPQLRAQNGGERIPLVRNVAIARGRTNPIGRGRADPIGRDLAGLVGRVLLARKRIGSKLAGAAVAILAHSPVLGTLGVRLDRLSVRSPADLLGETRAQALGTPPVFDSGPVRDVVIVLVTLRESVPVPDQFRLVSGTLGTLPPESDVELLDAVVDTAFVCLGYVGWAPGQLESELDSGALVPEETRVQDWLMQRTQVT